MAEYSQVLSWILWNLEESHGSSVQVSRVYQDYKDHCTRNNIDAATNITFGKTMYLVFASVRNRELNGIHTYLNVRFRTRLTEPRYYIPEYCTVEESAESLMVYVPTEYIRNNEPIVWRLQFKNNEVQAFCMETQVCLSALGISTFAPLIEPYVSGAIAAVEHVRICKGSEWCEELDAVPDVWYRISDVNTTMKTVKSPSCGNFVSPLGRAKQCSNCAHFKNSRLLRKKQNVCDDSNEEKPTGCKMKSNSKKPRSAAHVKSCGEKVSLKGGMPKSYDHNENFHICDVCKKTFKQKNSLTKHKATFHHERPHVCTQCGKAFAKKCTLTQHMKIHIIKQYGPCDVCGKTFAASNTLKRHIQTHTGEKPHACDVCGKCFTQKTNLVTHQKIHAGEKPHSCSICEKSFTRKSQLTTHMLVHSEERPYSCTVCGKAFKMQVKRDRHMMLHSGERPHICDICGKGYIQTMDLKLHKMKHCGLRPHICNECGEGFFYKNSLKFHMMKHTGERPYVCEACGKRFKSKNCLKSHKLVHSADRPYLCDLCGKGFKSENCLKLHKVVHSADRPYICGVCGKGFKLNAVLKAHMITAHKGDLEKFVN